MQVKLLKSVSFCAAAIHTTDKVTRAYSESSGCSGDVTAVAAAAGLQLVQAIVLVFVMATWYLSQHFDFPRVNPDRRHQVRRAQTESQRMSVTAFLCRDGEAYFAHSPCSAAFNPGRLAASLQSDGLIRATAGM
ncbi:hypothetical protein F2P81_025224 [Scophthalmus maximus]|uniref:Uncharacterized protein n=1 Tax=Scophthalmus maximus TaxID=52904 RepID=A0A6A4RR90_SCOMX|nr:hypothetical protein F2P81_026205 [Scophthalmus maximus]KAF0022598.1 hypothetical protein F2P81_025224 [Scophthalmus maximus]